MMRPGLPVFPLGREIHLVHQGQLDQVRAAQPGIDLGRGHGQLAAAVVGDQEQKVLCEEHDAHVTGPPLRGK